MMFIKINSSLYILQLVYKHLTISGGRNVTTTTILHLELLDFGAVWHPVVQTECDVLENGPFSVLGCKVGRHLLRWVY
jgi:hypothetical protein